MFFFWFLDTVSTFQATKWKGNKVRSDPVRSLKATPTLQVREVQVVVKWGGELTVPWPRDSFLGWTIQAQEIGMRPATQTSEWFKSAIELAYTHGKKRLKASNHFDLFPHGLLIGAVKTKRYNSETRRRFVNFVVNSERWRVELSNGSFHPFQLGWWLAACWILGADSSHLGPVIFPPFKGSTHSQLVKFIHFRCPCGVRLVIFSQNWRIPILDFKTKESSFTSRIQQGSYDCTPLSAMISSPLAGHCRLNLQNVAWKIWASIPVWTCMNMYEPVFLYLILSINIYIEINHIMDFHQHQNTQLYWPGWPLRFVPRIYSSQEGRCLITAAAFTKGFLEPWRLARLATGCSCWTFPVPRSWMVTSSRSWSAWFIQKVSLQKDPKRFVCWRVLEMAFGYSTEDSNNFGT